MGAAKRNPQSVKLAKALRAASKDLDLPVPTLLQAIKCGDAPITDVICDYWEWYGGNGACEAVSSSHLQSSPYRYALGDCMPRRKNTSKKFPYKVYEVRGSYPGDFHRKGAIFYYVAKSQKGALAQAEKDPGIADAPYGGKQLLGRPQEIKGWTSVVARYLRSHPWKNALREKYTKGNPRKRKNPTPVGKAQKFIYAYAQKRPKGFMLTDITYRDARMHFGTLMKGASALAKKGLIDFDGAYVTPRKRKNPGCRDAMGFVPTPECRGQQQDILLFFHEMKRSDPKFTLKDAWEISKGKKPVTKLSKKTLAKAKRDAPVAEQTVLAFNPRKRKNPGERFIAKKYAISMKEATLLARRPDLQYEIEDFADQHRVSIRSPLVRGFIRDLLNQQSNPRKRKNADHRPDERYGKLKGVLPSEYLRGKAAHDADFSAGYRAGQKASRKQKNLSRKSIESRYRRVSNKHQYGSWWIDGFQTANSDFPSPENQSIAVKLGLAHGKWNPRKRKKVSSSSYPEVEKAIRSANRYARQYNKLMKDSLSRYGRHGSPISGVGRSHFPASVKSKMRGLLQKFHAKQDEAAAEFKEYHPRTDFYRSKRSAPLREMMVRAGIYGTGHGKWNPRKRKNSQGMTGVLRSGYFPKNKYGGTQLFLMYENGSYVVRSRFQQYYRSRKVKPNTKKGRETLARATKKFEDLL